jgi:hypothetical protein
LEGNPTGTRKMSDLLSLSGGLMGLILGFCLFRDTRLGRDDIRSYREPNTRPKLEFERE